jgi:hypothetical protein
MSNEPITMNSELAKFIMRGTIEHYNLRMTKFNGDMSWMASESQYAKDWRALCMEAMKFAVEHLPE